MHKNIKIKLNPRNTSYCSVQNSSPSLSLSTKYKVKTCRIISPLVISSGCEVRSPVIKGGTQAEDFQKNGTEEDISAKEDKVTGHWRKLRNEELHDSLFLNKHYPAGEIKNMGKACSTHMSE